MRGARGGKAAQYRRGLRDGIPIFLGYLAVSFSFGILARGAGLGRLAATVMSATNLTSAGQFAALALISAGAPYAELAATQLVINLRYCLMSTALSQKVDPAAPLYHRFIMAFGVTDEVFGVSSGVRGALSPFYSYGLMSVAIPGWTLGTLLGITLGGVMPARLLSALGVALYGMFIAVVVPPARKSRVVLLLVVASMGASCLFAYAPLLRGISSGLRIILLTVVIAGAGAVLFPVEEEEGADA